MASEQFFIHYNIKSQFYFIFFVLSKYKLVYLLNKKYIYINKPGLCVAGAVFSFKETYKLTMYNYTYE